ASGRASRAALATLAGAVTLVGLAIAFHAGLGRSFWSGGLIGALAAGLALGLALERLARRGVLTSDRATQAIVVVCAIVPALNLGRFAEWATPVPGWLVTLLGIAFVATVTGRHGQRVTSIALAAYLAWGTVAIGIN